MNKQTVDRTKSRSYLMIGGAAVFGLLVGLGIGVLAAGEAEADAAAPPALREIQDQWLEAWNEADGESIVAMMAPGARHYCPGTGADGAAGNELVEFVETGLTIADIEPLGSLSMDTPGDSSGTSQDHLVVAQHSVDGHAGYLSVLHLRGPEDSLQVLSHRAFP